MLKIGKTYYLKTWEELKKASNGDYSGALDFGEILFLSRIKIFMWAQDMYNSKVSLS